MHLRIFLHTWGMNIAQQIIWRKKLEEYGEMPILHALKSNMIEYSLKMCIFFMNDIVCM